MQISYEKNISVEQTELLYLSSLWCLSSPIIAEKKQKQKKAKIKEDQKKNEQKKKTI